MKSKVAEQQRKWLIRHQTWVKVTIPESEELGGQAITIYGPDSGTAPQMFLLEGTWQWPKERQNIEVAYPDFAKWNADHNYLDWVKNSKSELIWQ